MPATTAAAFTAIIGTDGIAEGNAAQAFAADGVTPQCVVFPATIDQLSRCLAAAHECGLAVIAVGNGTQLGIGGIPRRYDIALSTQRLRHVVAHEAADMTVTVEAGVTLAGLNATLAAAGQLLPLDPPRPERTTIGALIATNASGPLRLSQGTVRDLLIGITAVLADGRIVHGGGRVVKNVAGYDLMKLFTGSFGTLGIIAEATFKVRPCSASEAVFVVTAQRIDDAAHCALSISSATVTPLYVELLSRRAAQQLGMNGADAAVVVGCGGSPEEIDVQHARLTEAAGGRRVQAYRDAEAVQMYTAVRDLPGRDGASHGCTISVLPSKLGALLQRIDDETAHRELDAVLVAHAGNGAATIRLRAVEDASDSVVPFMEWIRAAVSASTGYAVFDAIPTVQKARLDPWGGAVPGLALMRGIKQQLDPRDQLSPGRFVGGI